MNEILIVDDMEKLCLSLKKNFDQLGYSARYALNGKDALKFVMDSEISAVLLDISLGYEDGIEVLRQIKELRSQLPVIMITGFGTIRTAVDSIKIGAFDYIQKPLDFNKLLVIVENAIRLYHLEDENRTLKERLIKRSFQPESRNPAMNSLFDKADRLARTDLPILIVGESGTGKEGLADFIHNHSNRQAREIVKVNCAAFPDNLLDNELFGHEKGAFTGATGVFRGMFEEAGGSTLLLDEIGDMALPTQAKILRALQNKEIRRLGGNKTIRIDARFIASTNKDLTELIENGEFRQDLYYRLSNAILHIPPLRERREDIPLLIDTFLKESSTLNGRVLSVGSSSLYDRLTEYDWPGNVRELKNAISYAAAITLKDCIGVEDLPPQLNESYEGNGMIRENEKYLIKQALQKSGNNKKLAAEFLNISRRTLYNKLEKYDLAH